MQTPMITCPVCETSYTPTRCGLDLVDHTAAVIVCKVCATHFEALVSNPPDIRYFKGYRPSLVPTVKTWVRV